mmetsp:Transcript_87175/g.233463  ORF Transcript_87175/g.233463 Transcript_87175/m.233463 type:complete len:217 (-) Transcript_87175:219-869(-)
MDINPTLRAYFSPPLRAAYVLGKLLWQSLRHLRLLLAAPQNRLDCVFASGLSTSPSSWRERCPCESNPQEPLAEIQDWTRNPQRLDPPGPQRTEHFAALLARNSAPVRDFPSPPPRWRSRRSRPTASAAHLTVQQLVRAAGAASLAGVAVHPSAVVADRLLQSVRVRLLGAGVHQLAVAERRPPGAAGPPLQAALAVLAVREAQAALAQIPRLCRC